MKTKFVLLSSLFLAAAWLTACANRPAPRTEIRLSSDAAAAQHGIHNETLRRIMWDLTLTPAARLPDDANDLRPPRWKREDAERVLGAMAESAKAIPDVLADADLPEASKVEFRALATHLRNNTLRLRAEVPTLSPEEIARRFDALQDTCIACHERFRVIPLIPDR